MELKGKIELINETKIFGSNGFRKREMVLGTELDSDYPQSILVEFMQDKCDLLDSLSVGQDVTVSINLRGRKWTNNEGVDKYFNTIQGWRIEALGEGQVEEFTGSEEEDDLTF